MDNTVAPAARLSPRVLAAIFLAALLVRAVALADLSRSDPWFATPVGSERTAVEEARRLAREDFRIDRPHAEPPLYPHWLALLISIAPGAVSENPASDTDRVPDPALAWTAKGAQALLDAATALLVAAIAFRLVGRRGAVIAGGIHALGFLPVFHSAQFLDTTVSTFLALFSLRLALGAAEQRSATLWVSAGAAAGLAAIAHTSFLAWVPVLAAAPWLAAPGGAAAPRPERIRAAALLVAGAVGMILPVAVANLRLGGDRVLIAAECGELFYVGNRRGGGIGADGLSRPPAGARREALRREAAHLELASERSAHYFRLAGREIAADPAAFLGRLATKGHALLSSADIPGDKGFAEMRERSWTLRILPARSGLVIPLALAGIIFSRRLLARRALLLALLAAHAAVTIAFIASARERVPLLALAAIPAGAALAEIFDRTRPARRRAAVAGLSFGLVFLLAWDPHGWRERGGDPDAPVSLGAALERSGDAEGARASYERALAIDPDHADAHWRLGNLDLAAGRMAAAEGRFRSAVASDPEFARGWNSLGMLLLFTERGPEAAACFERAAAADPHFAPPRMLLGQMHEDAGRTAAARPLYEAARRIDPGTPLYGLLEARLLWKLHRTSEARSLVFIVLRNASRPLDAQETKLRKEIEEDLELWPEGPPLVQPPPGSVSGED